MISNYQVSELYIDRVQSQEDIAKLLIFCMEDLEKIGYKEFKQISENISNEIYSCVKKWILNEFLDIFPSEKENYSIRTNFTI